MKSIDFLREHNVAVDQSLELFGDIETYNETLVEFQKGIDGKLERIEKFYKDGDMPNYAILVHSLKSDCKYFGFMELAKLAEEAENKSKTGDLYAIQEGFPILQDACNKAIGIASEYLHGEKEQRKDMIASNIIPTSGEVYNRPTILVADDSSIIQNFVQRVFQGKYGVGIAKNGQETINIINSNLENNNIVAVLLDLNMPGVDGFSVLEYMRENNLFKKTPVSIISGDSSKETIERAFTYPIVDMLSKPFNDRDIQRIIEKTILYRDLKY